MRCLAVISLLFICSGCTAMVVGAAAGTAGSTAGGVYLNGSQSADNQLAGKVKSAFASHREWDKYRLDAAAEDGVVTIYGFVPSPGIKAQTYDVARNVPGVNGVISRVTYIPPGMMEVSSSRN